MNILNKKNPIFYDFLFVLVLKQCINGFSLKSFSTLASIILFYTKFITIFLLSYYAAICKHVLLFFVLKFFNLFAILELITYQSEYLQISKISSFVRFFS